MSRIPLVAVLASTVFILAASAQQPQDGRRIASNGRPLAEQLRSGDRRVFLPMLTGPWDFAGPPPGMSRERYWTVVCPLVAVLRVESVVPGFVYRDDMDRDVSKSSFRNISAPEDQVNWVISTIHARLEHVVNGVPALEEGQQIVVQDDGGTAMLRGVEVVAYVPWQRPLVSGRRYLVFGSIYDGKLLRTATYEEPSPSGLLVGIGPQDSEGDRLDTLNVEQALLHVQQEMSRQ